jgi:hypothetical protein
MGDGRPSGRILFGKNLNQHKRHPLPGGVCFCGINSHIAYLRVSCGIRASGASPDRRDGSAGREP